MLNLTRDNTYYIQYNDRPSDGKFKILDVIGDNKYLVSMENERIILSYDEISSLGHIRVANFTNFDEQLEQCVNYDIIMKDKPLLKGLPISYNKELDLLQYDKKYWQMSLIDPITKTYKKYKVNKKRFRKYIKSPYWMSTASELKNYNSHPIDLNGHLLNIDVTLEILTKLFPNSNPLYIQNNVDNVILTAILGYTKNSNITVSMDKNVLRIFKEVDYFNGFECQKNKLDLLALTTYPYSFTMRTESVDEFIELGGLNNIDKIIYTSKNNKGLCTPNKLAIRQYGYYDKRIRSFCNFTQNLSVGIVYQIPIELIKEKIDRKSFNKLIKKHGRH